MSEPIPRLHIVEHIALATNLDCYFSLRGLAAYCSLSVRVLYTHLADPLDPLPHFKVGGRVLVRRSDFDRWIERHRARGRVPVDAVVSDVLSSLRTPRTRARLTKLHPPEAPLVFRVVPRPDGAKGD